MCQQLVEPLANMRHILKGSVKLSHSIVDQDGDQPENWQVEKAQDICYLVELALTRTLFHK